VITATVTVTGKYDKDLTIAHCREDGALEQGYLSLRAGKQEVIVSAVELQQALNAIRSTTDDDCSDW
jgi:hypothetical protein